MARYVILRHEDRTPPRGRAPLLVIRDGWSWLGFVVPLLWLLWHRLWFAAFGVFAASLAIALLAQNPQWASLALPFNLLVGLFVGLEGQGWRIGAARPRGYRLADVVEADTQEAAELRFADMAGDESFEAPLAAAMVPGRGLAAAEAPDFLFAAPGGVNR
ncbi:DUF2628 domain-containing protein [Oceaniradius stylonematis]|uniref:DUF2628 domain-containing protein n=1 Tax=Oceaniradius stylonematis TaxID=2184161 RepID=UPI000F40B18D|nr:MAG: DUF2628 domain-containing protein [Oricola sp.]